MKRTPSYAAAWLILLGSPLGASVIYQQSPTYVPPNGSAGLGWTSTLGTTDGGFQTFDNFLVSNAANVDTVSWIGLIRDQLTPANNPVVPTTLTWDLSFSADSAGVPGSVLYDVQEPAASVTATQLGTTLRGTDTVFVYEFSATLPSEFAVAANTTYWFSPLSIQSSFNPLFVWLDGTGGDGSSYQNALNPDGSVSASDVRDEDRAFTLSNVPEPNTAWMAALFLLAILASGRPGRRFLLRRR